MRTMKFIDMTLREAATIRDRELTFKEKLEIARVLDRLRADTIELAPILGLSDVIVDIVETGKTLKENDLAVVEKFLSISARLIANRASFRFRTEEIEKLTALLKEQVKK